MNQANGNGATPASEGTGETVIDDANDNGGVPISCETATAGAQRSGNGERADVIVNGEGQCQGNAPL